jgi:TonB family protein
MSDTWRDCEGQLVDGAFTLRRHLGGSDHSVVFLTERLQGQPQKAAIKFIQADAANADRQLARWKQAAQLSHPNLIKLFETGRCQLAGMDLLYVVMECAEENLSQFLPQRALSPAETRDMLEPFLDTLTYLHSQGFVQGHIKPSNILAIDDQLKLSSDSLCRIGEARGSIGKPDAYTPPEAATQKASPAGDVWSLGVTLVETLTQRLPDNASAPSQPAAQEDLALPDTLPQPFLDIARHCLRRDSQRRWTVAEISNRLNPPPTPPAPTVAAQTTPAQTTPAPTPIKSAPLAPPEVAPPPKPPAFIDPLSVPLSPVAPLGKKQTLQNQTVPGKSSPAISYYIVIGVLTALTLGAVLAIPRLLNRGGQTEPASPIANRPNIQPDRQPTPTKQESVPSNTPPKSQKPTPAPALQTQDLAQDSSPATNEKKSSKDQASAAPESASLRTAVPRSGTPPSAPFVANRDASIAAGAVTPGEVLTQVLPDISDKSRSTIRGTVKVIVKVRVDSSGNVTTAELAATGPSRFFADAALDAAHRWDFAPAKVDGHNVPSEWLLHFNFTQVDTTVTPLPTKP